MKRARIVHCLAAVATGGVERRRLLLARLLDPCRYEQRILACEAAGPLQAELEGLGLSVLNLQGTAFNARALALAISECRDWSPDIVHGAVFEGSMLAVAGGLVSGAKIVVEETSFAEHRSPAGRALFRAMVGAADACVAVSPTVGEHLRSVGGLPVGKINVIKNGMFAPVRISSDEAAALRRSVDIPEEAFVVGTVARLFDYIKRVSDLIIALSELKATNTSTYLLVVGDGPDRASLERLATSLGVYDRVRFVGHHADIGKFYSIMDVFALVSTQEGMPLSLIEAMLAGVACIGTPVGGINDIITQETGVLVPIGAPTVIASALKALEMDEQGRAAMAARGKLRAEREFGADRYARDVDQFYRELLARPPRVHQRVKTAWRRIVGLTRA